MKNILYTLVIVLTTFGFVACDNVNSLHDKYLAEGEDFYVGKVDSFKIYGGANRAKFVVWVGDFRATSLLVSRLDTTLTYRFNLSTTNRKDSMVFYIDKLIEGTNVISWNTWNADNTVKSIPQGTSVTTWGPRFESFLTNRVAKTVTNNPLLGYIVTWDGANVKEPVFSTYAFGHEVMYTTKANNDTIVPNFYDKNSLSTPPATSKMPNYNPANTFVKYRMLFKPVSACIDTFRTQFATLNIP